MKSRFLFAPVPILIGAAAFAVDFWTGMHVGIFLLICFVSAGSVWELGRAFSSESSQVPFRLSSLCVLLWLAVTGGVFLLPERVAGLFHLSLTGPGGIILTYGGVMGPLFLFIVTYVLYGIRTPSPGRVRGMLLGFGLLVFFSTIYMQAFLLLHLFSARPATGTFWVLFIVLVNKGSDTGAYLVGKWIGSRKMTPRLSPNKTWEGLVGGLLSGVLITVPFALFSRIGSDRSVLLVLGIGLFLSLAAAAGDLVGSLLKRGAEVEDSSVLFPELGGILDISDCFLVSLPVSLLFLLLIG